MSEDPVVELRELVESLSEWLRYQRRLGRAGLRGEPAVAPTPAAAQATEEIPTLEEIRAEMGSADAANFTPGRKIWCSARVRPAPG